MLRKCKKHLFFAVFILLLAPMIFCSSGLFVNNIEISNSFIDNSVRISDIYYDGNNNVIYDYTIENYDMNISVGDDNVFHIVETIDVNFRFQRHGIYRTIVLKNNIERNDGSKSIQIAKLSNLRVNEEYSTTKNGEEIEIKIGDPNSYVKDDKRYVISYDYSLGKDDVKEYDELYFNIIGNEWTTKIKKVTFSIEMPKSFDSSTLGFSMGSKGAVGYENLEFNVEGNTIKGYTTESLEPGHGLTVRMELPQNYFSRAKDLWLKYLIICTIVPSVLLIAIVIFAQYKKKQNKYVSTVEFYPPESLNSLDVALIYKNNASKKDVISLLVYLAHKGYLSIEELDEQDNEVRITKLREYQGSDSRESKFFNELFCARKSVLLSKISRYSFPAVVSSIAETTNTEEKKKYIDEKKNKKLNPILIISSLLVLLLSGILLVKLQGFWSLMVYVFPAVAIYLLLPFAYKTKNKILILFSIVWGGIPLGVIMYKVLDFGILYLLSSIYCVVTAVIVLLSREKLQFRTEIGSQLYSKIYGFRTFIKTAEKSRIDELCAENPSYFYDILPYAYVLGLSDVWIKKFEQIGIPHVEWYICTSHSFMTMSRFNAITSSMSLAARPIPSSSSSGGGFGGGRSGGGSSGGGSGGGGGGSW